MQPSLCVGFSDLPGRSRRRFLLRASGQRGFEGVRGGLGWSGFLARWRAWLLLDLLFVRLDRPEVARSSCLPSSPTLPKPKESLDVNL